MSSNSQDALKEEILKLNKQILSERNKRGSQVLRDEWNRAFAEEEFWDKFMQFCPQCRHNFFDWMHSLQYCRSYKGRNVLTLNSSFYAF